MVISMEFYSVVMKEIDFLDGGVKIDMTIYQHKKIFQHLRLPIHILLYMLRDPKLIFEVWGVNIYHI